MLFANLLILIYYRKLARIYVCFTLHNIQNKEQKLENIDIKPALNIIEMENSHKGSLIPILQKIQNQYGYLPKKILELLSKKTGIPASQIIGAATFYSQFRFEPIGKYLIKVCHGTACHISGAEKISDVFKDLLGIEEGKTTPDGLFTLESVACLGCCSLAPVVMINETTYGRLNPSKVNKIIKEYRKRG